MADDRRINWQGVRERIGLYILAPIGIVLLLAVLAHLLGLWGGPCDQCVDWSQAAGGVS